VANSKSSIEVNITVTDGRIDGTVVLLGPNKNRLEVAIVNPKQSENALEFETKDRNVTFYWRLTLSGAMKGLLHGSSGELLIDERVNKRPRLGPSPQHWVMLRADG
jgi:hypothetical protein